MGYTIGLVWFVKNNNKYLGWYIYIIVQLLLLLLYINHTSTLILINYIEQHSDVTKLRRGQTLESTVRPWYDIWRVL